MLFAEGDYSVTVNIGPVAAGIIATSITFVGKMFHGYFRDQSKAVTDGRQEYKEMLIGNTALTREVATALVTGSTALGKMADENRDMKSELRSLSDVVERIADIIGGNSQQTHAKAG